MDLIFTLHPKNLFSFHSIIVVISFLPRLSFFAFDLCERPHGEEVKAKHLPP